MVVVTGDVRPDAVAAIDRAAFRRLRASRGGARPIRPTRTLRRRARSTPCWSATRPCRRASRLNVVLPYDDRPTAWSRSATACASSWPAPCSAGAWRAWGCSRARRSRARPPVRSIWRPAARIALVQLTATPETWREALAVGEQELRRALTYGFTQAELDEELAIFRNELETAAAGAKTRESGEPRRPAGGRDRRRGRVHLAGYRSRAPGRAHPRPAPGRHRSGTATAAGTGASRRSSSPARCS